MSLELVFLLVLYAFLLVGVFFGDEGPQATFKKSAPRLAARIEMHLATGSEFGDPINKGRKADWLRPNAQPPGGF